MDHLSEIVKQEVSWYAAQGRGLDLHLLKSLDDINQTYNVVAIPDPNPDQEMPEVVVMARVSGDKVIIEADYTDRPLVKNLVAAGIPREQIILAYAGENPSTN